MAQEIFHKEMVAIPAPANMMVVTGVQKMSAVSTMCSLLLIYCSVL